MFRGVIRLFILLGFWPLIDHAVWAVFPEPKDVQSLKKCFDQAAEHLPDPKTKVYCQKEMDTFANSCKKVGPHKSPLTKRVWNAFVSLYLVSAQSKSKELKSELLKWDSFMWDNVATHLLSGAQQWGALSGHNATGLIFFRTESEAKKIKFFPYDTTQKKELRLYRWSSSIQSPEIQHDILMHHEKLIHQSGLCLLFDSVQKDGFLLSLYWGEKFSFPLLEATWFLPCEEELADYFLPSQILFFPVPAEYQDLPLLSQEETVHHFISSIGSMRDEDSSSVLSSFQEGLSVEEFLEKYMLAWLGIRDEKHEESAASLSETLQEISSPVETDFAFVEKTSPPRRGKEKSITPHDQPTWKRPQNVPPKEGMREHVRAYFSNHLSLQNLNIKRIKTTGSHVVIHRQINGKTIKPLTLVKPHGSDKK